MNTFIAFTLVAWAVFAGLEALDCVKQIDPKRPVSLVVHVFLLLCALVLGLACVVLGCVALLGGLK